MLQALFTDGVDEITVHGLTQWDIGQEMQITLSSLPAEFQVHFGHKRNDTAYVVAATAADGVATVQIPNIVLQQATPVKAWIYLVGIGTGETVKTINLPIVPRAKPSDYAYTEIEILNYESVIRKAQGETKAPYIGENNNWYVWDEELERFVDSGIGAVIEGTVTAVDGVEPAANGTVYLDAVRTVTQSLSSTQKSQARTNIEAAAEAHDHLLTDLSGTLSVAKGGTGATTAAAARTKLGAVAMSKTSVYLPLEGWMSGDDGVITQTVNVSGVTAYNTVFVSASPYTHVEYHSCMVHCTAQGDGTLTFVAEDTPSMRLNVYLVIFD